LNTGLHFSRTWPALWGGAAGTPSRALVPG